MSRFICSNKSGLAASLRAVAILALSTCTTVVLASVQLVPIGTYKTNIFASGAAEIVTYDAASKRLFVVNADSQVVDIIDIADPTTPTLVDSFDVTPYGKQANSVAVKNGIVAAAVEADPKQNPGRVVFFNASDGAYINDVQAGALPDMITFTPDGSHALVANEGEPNDDYTVDPEGSVSIIDLSGGVASLTQADVATADFTAFNYSDLDWSININGPGATVAQDLEPEYITVFNKKNSSHNPRWRAAVVLQENNGIAIVDVKRAEVVEIFGLGFKDYSKAKNAIDASNADGAIRIRQWPVWGMYQPDSIAAYKHGRKNYLVTANEGDARDYLGSPGFSEETRVGDLLLDPHRFPDAATLQLDANLGRLKTTTTRGDFDGDGDNDAIFSYGARSFSIWDTRGNQLFDSGSDVAHITASQLPANFNSDDEENGSFDDRSDDKGAEPEGLAIGEVNNRTYGFIGLERVGGIMVYDITNPRKPFFVQYVNTRNFDEIAGPGTGGDMSPEGLVFISADDSPNGKPLLVVSYEVSGSTTIFQIND